MTELADAPLTDVATSGVRDGLGAVQDVDEGKRQVLVDIPWEVLDTYNTDFSRDCFDEFLGVRMPAMCWQHLKTEPIGRAVQRTKGARANQFVAQFSDFDAVPRARQAFAQIRDGEITDFSFYYDQARAVPHPSVRSAIRFTKARMPEISPVTVGSIPGAMATGIRGAADMAGVAELVRTGVITEAEGRTMLGLAGDVPTVGERQPKRESITLAPNGTRSFTITFGDDGAVTTSGDSTTTSTGTGDVSDPRDLIAAVDGAIDAAIAYLAPIDLTSLPSEVGMAYQLLQAADIACDELMDAAGLDDYDEDADDGDRAAKTKPYGDVEYADPGYQDDKKHRYPISDAEKVRAAWSYINQADNASKYTAEQLTKIKQRIKAAAEEYSVEIDDSGSRAAEDLNLEAAVASSRLSRR